MYSGAAAAARRCCARIRFAALIVREVTPGKVFDLNSIERVVEEDDLFNNPRPGDRRNDPTMSGGIIERL